MANDDYIALDIFNSNKNSSLETQIQDDKYAPIQTAQQYGTFSDDYKQLNELIENMLASSNIPCAPSPFCYEYYLTFFSPFCICFLIFEIMSVLGILFFANYFYNAEDLDGNTHHQLIIAALIILTILFIAQTIACFKCHGSDTHDRPIAPNLHINPKGNFYNNNANMSFCNLFSQADKEQAEKKLTKCLNSLSENQKNDLLAKCDENLNAAAKNNEQLAKRALELNIKDWKAFNQKLDAIINTQPSSIQEALTL